VWGMRLDLPPLGRRWAPWRGAAGETRVAYVRVAEFNTKTVEELARVAARLRRGTAPSVWVVDLRDNMGGLLSAGVRLCEAILPRGAPIVKLRGAEGPIPTVCAETREALLGPLRPNGSNGSNDPPLLLVLVNEQTASSAELAAAALRDSGPRPAPLRPAVRAPRQLPARPARAPRPSPARPRAGRERAGRGAGGARLVGSQSFGKGSIQAPPPPRARAPVASPRLNPTAPSPVNVT